MKTLINVGLLVALLLPAAPVFAQQTWETLCGTPALSDDQVKTLIANERAKRSDLPKSFAKSRIAIRRDRCYYVAIESLDPPKPEASHQFTLNRNGVIVDASSGIAVRSGLTCPARTFGETDLARIVAQARATREDLPLPFATARVNVSRMNCLYLYFEYRVPEARGDYQVFTIDPLGELMDAHRSKPY